VKKTAILIMLLLAASAAATPKLPRPGSYIIVNAVDEASGKRLDNYTVKVSMEFPREYSSLGYRYEQTFSGEDRVGISMPPPEYGAVAKITVSSDGYSQSGEESMTSEYYWKNLGKDHLARYDFKLAKESGGFCCLPALPLALAALSAILAKLAGMA
jgi:hypothetical protein